MELIIRTNYKIFSKQINFISYEDAYNKGFEDMQRRIPCLNKILATYVVSATARGK